MKFRPANFFSLKRNHHKHHAPAATTMAPVELTQLSSNWKKLQKTLKQETPVSEQNLKRKRTNEEIKTRVVKRQMVHSSGKTQSNGGMNPPKELKGRPRSKSTVDEEKKEAETESRPATSNGIREQSKEEAQVNEGVSPTALAGKYIALDCEMVGFGPTPDRDSQLARVSLVDYHGHQLYDSFVEPQVPITDYRTHITGITEETLKSARPFKEVQQDVATLLLGRIVVAHAIKNDLDVLMLSHPKRDIRDTSRHPGFRVLSAGKSPSLRKLAKELLGLEIQMGAHSSIEDARTCMLLFKQNKGAFESEHAKTWGRPKDNKLEAVDGDVVGTGVPKKKKKKKTKR
jgi:RNA exonuclease 4